MRLAEFRDRVCAELGPRLERATPATVEEFVARMTLELDPSPPVAGVPVEVNEAAGSWEQVIHEFLGRVLEHPSEDAVIQLWLLTLMLHFQALDAVYGEQFADLLRRPSECQPDD